ncbi:hypothetical protein F5146DRAFT_1074297 [Armillaria mellea]|nr:hypothetical protein F5146DRAFT_1074297 [Armillaria mellea]
MGSKVIPAYYESESLNEAWTALVTLMDGDSRGQLFFLCPEPGNTGRKWQPSWDQVMTKAQLVSTFEVDFRVCIDRDETRDEDSCDVWCIAKALVQGLDVVEEGDRCGKLIVQDWDGKEHGFEITAAHTHPILGDTYTMIYTCEFESSRDHSWVVGRSLPGGKFEKVSVLEMSYEESYSLRCFAVKRQYILI